MKEFSITIHKQKVRFIRAEVFIDKDSDIIDKLTDKRLPSWKKEKVFLEVLVEGDANLYLLQDKNLVKFFFNTITKDSIQQLLYRRYIVSQSEEPYGQKQLEDNNYIKSDNTFRQQLSIMVNCGGELSKRLGNIRYNRKQLTDYFQSFNEACNTHSRYYSGYFVKNDNERIDCLIKDNDWHKNPTKFIFKVSEKAKPNYLGIHSVKELGFQYVSNQEKFLHTEVQVDNSKNDNFDLAREQPINWKQKKLFLKVLVEGDANLYSIKEGDAEIFFFNTIHQADIQQLLFGQYKAYDENGENEIVIVDNTFKKQLHLAASCWGDKDNMTYRLKNLVYKKATLISYFESYNKRCDGNYLLE